MQRTIYGRTMLEALMPLVTLALAALLAGVGLAKGDQTAIGVGALIATVVTCKQVDDAQLRDHAMFLLIERLEKLSGKTDARREDGGVDTR